MAEMFYISFHYTMLIGSYIFAIDNYIDIDMQYAYCFHLPLTTIKNFDQRNWIATEKPYLKYQLWKSNVCIACYQIFGCICNVIGCHCVCVCVTSQDGGTERTRRDKLAQKVVSFNRKASIP